MMSSFNATENISTGIYEKPVKILPIPYLFGVVSTKSDKEMEIHRD